MLRVTVELLPHGSEEGKRHLGTCLITNTGAGTLQEGEYTVSLSKWDRPRLVWKRGSVKAFPRKKRGPWDLLYLALKNCVGNRNGG